MKNHERMYAAVLNSNKINTSYNYSALMELSREYLSGTTSSGQEYAVLKFIQNYCDASIGSKNIDLSRIGDPRKVFDLQKIRKSKFKINKSISSTRKIIRGPINHKSLIEIPTKKNKILSEKNNSNLTKERSNRSNCSSKDHFLGQSKEFRGWLLTALHKFEHKWISRGSVFKTGINRGAIWGCHSLFSAYQQYIWPAKINDIRWEGRFFEETDLCLSKLKEQLENSIASNDGVKAKKICAQILEWGGVLNRSNVSNHIKGMQESQLPRHLCNTRDYLNNLIKNGHAGMSKEFYDDNGNGLRLDSGTTKIYSLICDNFVMYDGRVASALGYLVRKWWEEKSLANRAATSYEKIPYCLRFSYDNNKKESTTGIKTRNPNPDNHRIFTPLKVDKNRLEENIQASWLLHRLLEEDKEQRTSIMSNFSYINNKQKRLRALEAAIFMIGYSVIG